MFKIHLVVTSLAIILIHFFPLEASLSIDKAPVIKTRLPATEGGEIEERITVQKSVQIMWAIY